MCEAQYETVKPKKLIPKSLNKSFTEQKKEFMRTIKSMHETMCTLVFFTIIDTKASQVLASCNISRYGTVDKKQNDSQCNFFVTGTSFKQSNEYTNSRNASFTAIKAKKPSFGGCKSGYLGRINIINMSRGGARSGKIAKKISHNSMEVYRQFGRTTSSIRMRMESDIKNYNLASNAVLKRQMDRIKSFEVLPKFAARARTAFTFA